MPRHGSLFSGILGFELGFEDHFESAWCSEVDKFCRAVALARGDEWQRSVPVHMAMALVGVALL